MTGVFQHRHALVGAVEENHCRAYHLAVADEIDVNDMPDADMTKISTFLHMPLKPTSLDSFLSASPDLAFKTANSRRGYWFVTHTVAVNIALTKEKLIRSGFYDLANAYQLVHVNY